MSGNKDLSRSGISLMKNQVITLYIFRNITQNCYFDILDIIQ